MLFLLLLFCLEEKKKISKRRGTGSGNVMVSVKVELLNVRVHVLKFSGSEVKINPPAKYHCSAEKCWKMAVSTLKDIFHVNFSDQIKLI